MQRDVCLERNVPPIRGNEHKEDNAIVHYIIHNRLSQALM